jgi:hypothetical protein
MTIKLFIPKKDYLQVSNAIRNSDIKHYPFTKKVDGYEIEVERTETPLLLFLILKYGRINNDGDNLNVQARPVSA